MAYAAARRLSVAEVPHGLRDTENRPITLCLAARGGPSWTQRVVVGSRESLLVVSSWSVVAAAHLAAAGLGVTIIPNNVVPHGLRAAVRSLRSPLVRELVAFTRRDWSPLAEAFLEVLQAQPWQPRPRVAADVG